MKFSSLVVLISVVFGVTFSSPTKAETFRTGWTQVQSMFVHDSEFGGCMVRIREDLSQVSGGQCTIWAAPSCSGELADPDRAALIYEALQIAYLTERDIRVEVDSTRKHNGHCVVTRVDFR